MTMGKRILTYILISFQLTLSNNSVKLKTRGGIKINKIRI